MKHSTHIEYGTHSKYRRWGQTQHVASQCTIGTTIICIIWHLLVVVEHLRASPECNGINS